MSGTPCIAKRTIDCVAGSFWEGVGQCWEWREARASTATIPAAQLVAASATAACTPAGVLAGTHRVPLEDHARGIVSRIPEDADGAARWRRGAGGGEAAARAAATPQAGLQCLCDVQCNPICVAHTHSRVVGGDTGHGRLPGSRQSRAARSREESAVGRPPQLGRGALLEDQASWNPGDMPSTSTGYRSSRSATIPQIGGPGGPRAPGVASQP